MKKYSFKDYRAEVKGIRDSFLKVKELGDKKISRKEQKEYEKGLDIFTIHTLLKGEGNIPYYYLSIRDQDSAIDWADELYDIDPYETYFEYLKVVVDDAIKSLDNSIYVLELDANFMDAQYIWAYNTKLADDEEVVFRMPKFTNKGKGVQELIDGCIDLYSNAQSIINKVSGKKLKKGVFGKMFEKLYQPSKFKSGSYDAEDLEYLLSL